MTFVQRLRSKILPFDPLHPSARVAFRDHVLQNEGFCFARIGKIYQEHYASLEDTEIGSRVISEVLSRAKEYAAQYRSDGSIHPDIPECQFTETLKAELGHVQSADYAFVFLGGYVYAIMVDIVCDLFPGDDEPSMVESVDMLFESPCEGESVGFLSESPCKGGSVGVYFEVPYKGRTPFQEEMSQEDAKISVIGKFWIMRLLLDPETRELVLNEVFLRCTKRGAIA